LNALLLRKNKPLSLGANPLPVFGDECNKLQEKSVIWLFLKIAPLITISMERGYSYSKKKQTNIRFSTLMQIVLS